MEQKVGSALVVGAGISGIRSALDLAELGHKVILIEKKPHLGGLLAQLDYQFPSDHCGMCKMLPTVERDACSQHCLRKGLFHENIEIMLSTEMVGLEGEPGHFHATLKQKPALVDAERCNGCGKCSEVCPVEASDAFNAGLSLRKAIYRPVPHNIPSHFVIDTEVCTRCGQCEKACPSGAIDLRLDRRKGFRILVVDDELIVRDSIKEWLDYEGFQVDVAESGEDALRALTDRSYQLMLVDVKMPGMSGIEVLECAREMHPDLHVVMMTAFATVETAIEAIKLGAREYLMKPFDPEVVVSLAVKLHEGLEPTGERRVEVGAVILASGVDFHDPAANGNTYGYGILPNVVTAIEFERILSGTGPNGGKAPLARSGREVRKIAWLQCVGSRNLQAGADYCSSVCCMFSVKEAVLAKEKCGPALDAAIFFMDMRTFGKEFQRYRDRAENERGVRFVRSRVHTVEPADSSGGLAISYTDASGRMHREYFDLVVLATGQKPIKEMESVGELAGIERNPWGFCRVERFSPGHTSREGVMAAGSFSGFRDISESIIEAGAASLAASRLIHSRGGTRVDSVASAGASAQNLVPITQRALIVGGGIAGMSAALAIADHGFEVDLIERSPELGGNLRLLHRALAGDSPGELLDGTVSAVGKHSLIHVHKSAQVVRSKGRVGHFTTTIQREDGTSATLEHGVTVLATGGGENKPNIYEYGQSEAVLTQLELEAKLHDGSLDPSGLDAVVMIQCAGSREEPRNYCSRVCCASALQNALYLKEKNPETSVTILYRDMMAYGFSEAFFTQARKAGVLFVQYETDRKPEVSLENGRPLIRALDPILERELVIGADILVLGTGVAPSSENARLADLFGVGLDRDGFFQEAESKWRPLDFLKEGIFMCGLAHSPRSIPETIATAHGAAQRALRILKASHLSVAGSIAEVHRTLCSLCEQCVSACPYGARWYDEEEDAIMVDPLSCQGCGMCAAICPNSASVLRGHPDPQVFAVIDAALDGSV